VTSVNPAAAPRGAAAPAPPLQSSGQAPDARFADVLAGATDQSSGESAATSRDPRRRPPAQAWEALELLARQIALSADGAPRVAETRSSARSSQQAPGDTEMPPAPATDEDGHAPTTAVCLAPECAMQVALPNQAIDLPGSSNRPDPDAHTAAPAGSTVGDAGLFETREARQAEMDSPGIGDQGASAAQPEVLTVVDLEGADRPSDSRDGLPGESRPAATDAPGLDGAAHVAGPSAGGSSGADHAAAADSPGTAVAPTGIDRRDAHVPSAAGDTPVRAGGENAEQAANAPERPAAVRRTVAQARAIVERFKAHELQPEEPFTGIRPSARPVETARQRIPEKPDTLTPPTARFDLPGAPLPASTSVRAVEGTTAPSPVDADGTLETQIVRALRVQWGRQGGEATIQLKPEYLGNLTVSLRVDQGVVTAQLVAASAEVRQWIEANEPLLRQGLSQQQLDLDRLIVLDEEAEAAPGDARNPDREPRDEPRRPRSRRDPDATFEVLV